MTDTSARPEGLSAYIAVTAAYWAFMLTDGALRMLVLLHFHSLGFSPVQLAYLFVLYEIAGMVTNISAGWIATRFGLTSMLYAGLGIQVLALLTLAQLDPNWTVGLSVALLTGSKNAVKGLGFLLGAALLATLGFVWAVVGMAAILTVILIAVLVVMPPGLPKGRKGAKFSEVFSKSANINWLSAARVFLFGARDVWFVVGIPIYFYAVLSDGTVSGNRTAFFMIGTFMAVWVILYGFVQASAPRILRASTRAENDLVHAAKGWSWALASIPAVLTVAALLSGGPQPWLSVILVAGLLAFGALFAINSALHSYLILAFTKSERVTMDVGFYYMANAGGRLLGTLLSGATYQMGGLPLMLATATAMVCIAAFLAGRLAPS